MSRNVGKALLVCVIVSSAASVCCLSAAATNRFAAEDIFALRWVANPEISPDGKLIAYSRLAMDAMTDRREARLWIVNHDGTDNRPLLPQGVAATLPRWSPDGTRLLYIAPVGGIPQVHVLWVRDGSTAQITYMRQPVRSAVWSPDSRSIAFASLVPRIDPPLYRMPPTPLGAQWADAPTIVTDLDYRADGVGDVTPGSTHVFVVAADGGAPRQVTLGDFDCTDPEWSADAKSLYFAADMRSNRERGPVGTRAYPPTDTEIYRVGIDGGTPAAITARRGPDERPVVSPRGDLIAYIGYDDVGSSYAVWQLYVAKPDGTERRSLTLILDREVANPVWASNGAGVYFTYGDRGQNRIGYVDLRGRFRKLVDGAGPVDVARPQPRNPLFSVSRNGTLAFALASTTLVSDLAIYDGASTRQLTDLNRELFAARRLGAVEEVRFKSSYDEKEIQGWIIKPPAFDPHNKYPLILSIHGGPWDFYGPVFAASEQLFASAGYVVLYMNPRGSSSYGGDFGNETNHDFPGHDYDDLMSGVDAMVASGYIDQRNLFVQGGSAGGVLTAWIVTRTNRFRAAVSAKTIVDWGSWALTADRMSMFQAFLGDKLPWRHPGDYQRKSPLFFVDQVQTPTMLVTGELDFRTPFSQAEQFYRALKFRGVDTALVRVPGSSHDLSNRPSQALAWTLMMLGWFERHRAPEAH